MGKLGIFVWGFLIFLLFSPISKSHAQLNAERKALSRLQSGKWESAQRLLRKSLQKDSTNIEATYVLASWFFSFDNPSFQVDSASYYTKKSFSLYHSLDARNKERVSKFPIDSLILAKLSGQIDSVAFEKAKQLNTEITYQRFIDNYASAKQIPNAIELRDEVSFLEALKVNTFHAYKDYLFRYPQSHRASDASERYERLLFEEKTRNKSIAEYKSFIKNYPASPYTAFAQKEVFEISTSKGEPDDFFAYLKENPDSPYRQFINDLLFHLYKEQDETVPDAILSDSLRHVMNFDARYWLPVLRNGKFGFIDQTGVEVLAPQFDQIDEQLKCGSIKEDILSLPDGYFSRTGKRIAPNSVQLKSIGNGFLVYTKENCNQLIHKSGRFIIKECFDEFKVLEGNFIAANRKGLFTLYTLTGRTLPITNISNVSSVEGLIILTRNGKKIINTLEQIAALASGSRFYDEFVFDEVQSLEKGLLLVKLSGLEGILSDKLQYIVPLDKHVLTKTPFGLIEKRPDGTRVLGVTDEIESNTWSNVRYYLEWLVLAKEGQEQLLHLPSKKIVEMKLDSVWFDRSLVFIQSGPNRKVYLSSTRAIDLPPDSKFNFIPGRDSVQFFFTDQKKKHAVFTLDKGDLLFSTEFALIESIGAEYFLVAKGAKKGILSRQGKVLVPVEMDAIIISSNTHVSLLKNKKFGLFNLKTRKLIKPEYERNLQLLDKNHLVVFKDGFYGVVTNNEKKVTEFEFSDVKAWSDSVIWVKKNYQWMLLNFYANKIVLDRIRDFSWIKNTEQEKIVVVQRENYYGVITNNNGLIIPVSFTDIINLGTLEEPLYFTEKYIEEAGIYIVVYYNKLGKLLRKQAYEEEEYERILCQD